MLSFLCKKFFTISTLVFLFILCFFFPTEVLAQQCGSGSSQEVVSCLRINGQCYSNPATQIPHNYTCSTSLPGGNGTCQGVVIGAACYDDGDQGCEVRGGGTYVIIACGGTGGGGGGGNCNHSYECKNNCNANKIVSSSKCGGSCGGTKVCCDGGCIPVPTPTPNPCTAPIITNVTRVSSTKVRVDWTPGANTTSQTIYIGPSKTGVQNNCLPNQSPACVVKDTSLGPARATYTTGPVLVPGKVYYIKIVNSGTCNLSSSISTYLSSCAVSPTSVTMNTNSTSTLNTTVSSSTDITKVHYSSSNTGIVTVSPADDTSYAYSTTLTSTATQGTAIITSDVYFGSTIACSATGNVVTTAPGAWWQTKDADIATNGDIKSDIPSATYKFDSDGPGGFPGVIAYGGTLSLNSGGISSKNWQANTTTNASKVYDYAYFESQIPATTLINDASSFPNSGAIDPTTGYYWYEYDGSVTGLPFTISSAANIGTKKVILLVKSADLNIDNTINLTDGQGFFMAIVGKSSGTTGGKIIVDPTVGGASAALEGIYLSDGQFSTGTNGGTDTRLVVRGSVAAYGGIGFQRDLVGSNTTTPAELFEYAPDQVMLFPKVLSVRKISWKEVAP